jgi:hypothetical protein
MDRGSDPDRHALAPGIELMIRSISERGGNILAFAVVIVVNTMANAVPLGGQTTGEVSAKYPSLFTPAGYVFSIWGLIYLGLAVFVVWQALPAQRSNQNLAAIRIPFLINCACNAVWIFLWHYDLLLLSMLFMLVILGSLIHVYRTLNIGLSDATAKERWIVHLPFSIYTGVSMHPPGRSSRLRSPAQSQQRCYSGAATLLSYWLPHGPVLASRLSMLRFRQ